MCRPSRDTAVRRKKARRACCPAGRNFPKGKFQSFLPYFLYFTKSRAKAAKPQKVLILFVRSRHCGGLLRGLQNLEAFLKKDLIVAVRSCSCGALLRGLRNLGASRKGNGFILFACTKRTKSTPEVCEPLDSGDDSNRRSTRCFCENDRRSSGNRQRRKLHFSGYRRQ